MDKKEITDLYNCLLDDYIKIANFVKYLINEKLYGDKKISWNDIQNAIDESKFLSAKINDIDDKKKYYLKSLV